MTLSTFAAKGPPIATAARAGYPPGVCNIGAEEMARRRRAGHMGRALTSAVLVAGLAVTARAAGRDVPVT